MTSPRPVTTISDNPNLADAVDRLQRVRDSLCGAFFERRREVTSLLTALLAGEHALLLGPPGTAKSALTNALADAIAPACQAPGVSTYRAQLFTKFTTPEEVFGPISLAGLEQDVYRRCTSGYLPTTVFYFADEVFKANSAILNGLLTALNERQYDDGGQRISIPLQLCVGASNELPQDDSLGALYDRFVLRHWVEYLTDRGNMAALLAGSGTPQVVARMQAGDLDELRQGAAQVVVPQDVIDAVLDLRDTLASEQGITASDRRWVKCMKLIRAHAMLHGRTVATRRDLAILAHALWDQPEQRAAVQATVTKAISPELAKVVAILDMAREDVADLDGTDDVAQLAGMNKAIKAKHQEAHSLLDPTNPDEGVADVVRQIVQLQRKVAGKLAQAIGC